MKCVFLVLAARYFNALRLNVMADSQRRIQKLVEPIITYLRAHRGAARGVDIIFIEAPKPLKEWRPSAVKCRDATWQISRKAVWPPTFQWSSCGTLRISSRPIRWPCLPLQCMRWNKHWNWCVNTDHVPSILWISRNSVNGSALMSITRHRRPMNLRADPN